MDLSYDQLDAILRDEQTPGDVRLAVQTEVGIRNYLNTITFSEPDSGGMISVQHKSADDTGPISEASPSSNVQQRVDDVLDRERTEVDATFEEEVPPPSPDVPPPPSPDVSNEGA